MSTLRKLKSIFLSYRRDDSAGDTGRIFDHLQNTFGDDQLFFDVNAIDAGNHWANDIQGAVNSCDVLLAIIGKRWLTIADEHGRRRLDSNRDYVRLEISTAIRRQIRVIPVLVGKAELPKREGLPESLKPLLDYQSIEIRHDRFHQDVKDLIAELEKAGVPRKNAVGPSAAGSSQAHNFDPTLPERKEGASADAVPTQLGREAGYFSNQEPLASRSPKATFLEQLLQGEHTVTWKRALLGDCLRIFHNKPSKSRDRLPGQYPYYGVSGVVEYVNYYQYDGEYILINGAGSSLTETSTQAVSFVRDRFSASSSVYVARVDGKYRTELMPQYLAHSLAAVDFRPYVQGAVQPFLSLKSLKEIPIAIPPMAEQMRVVRLLNEHLANLERAREGLERQLALLEELETALYRDVLGKRASD